MKILQTYHCQDQIADYVTALIVNQQRKNPKGTMKLLLSIIDRRSRFTLKRFPDLFFEAVFQYQFIPGRKIIAPGHPAEQDTLKIRAMAAEELTREQFDQRANEKRSNDLLNEAKKLINQ